MKKYESKNGIVEIVEYVNTLDTYQGYIQMSDKPICCIFKDFGKIELKPTSGFIYEAHFYSKSENKSIAIRQINESWYVAETENIKLTDIQTYIGIDKLKVKMAQIWEEEEDKLCENMKVKKLQKVVFVGFEGETK